MRVRENINVRHVIRSLMYSGFTSAQPGWERTHLNKIIFFYGQRRWKLRLTESFSIQMISQCQISNLFIFLISVLCSGLDRFVFLLFYVKCSLFDGTCSINVFSLIIYDCSKKVIHNKTISLISRLQSLTFRKKMEFGDLFFSHKTDQHNKLTSTYRKFPHSLQAVFSFGSSFCFYVGIWPANAKACAT